MLFLGLSQKVTRARPTSNMMYSAAAIAVVSEVIPDKPGASLFISAFQQIKPLTFVPHGFLSLLLLASTAATALPQASLQTKMAMNSAIYNNTLANITPMLFHHIELGMTYEAVENTVGKSALYCDSGESYCNADNGLISKKCLNTEFIQPNKNWMCHWDGTRTSRNMSAKLDVWFVGLRVSQVAATMPNGNVYRRDSGNTIHLDRHETY